ncbi:MAG: GTPase HflX, partial [Clostridium sp.]
CHVVDASSDDALEQIKAVEEVLAELGAIDKETILALNKIDKIDKEKLEELKSKISYYDDIIEISAKEEINIDGLLNEIEEKLPYSLKKCEYIIPYERGDVVSLLHRSGRVLEEEYVESGTKLTVEVDDEVYNKTKEYIINILN